MDMSTVLNADMYKKLGAGTGFFLPDHSRLTGITVIFATLSNIHLYCIHIIENQIMHLTHCCITFCLRLGRYFFIFAMRK